MAMQGCSLLKRDAVSSSWAGHVVKTQHACTAFKVLLQMARSLDTTVPYLFATRMSSTFPFRMAPSKSSQLMPFLVQLEWLIWEGRAMTAKHFARHQHVSAVHALSEVDRSVLDL